MRFLACLLVLFSFFPEHGKAAEFTLLPSITVREEVNDNVLLSTSDPKKEYITSIVPAFLLHYQTPFWFWDVAYSRDQRHYERQTVEDDAANTLTLRSRTEVAKKTLYVEISDDLARTSLDISRDFTAQSPVVNQATRNIFTVNPYGVLQPTPATTYTLGHSYTNTKFTSHAGIDRTDDVTYLLARNEVTSRLTVTTGIRYLQNSNNIQDFDQVDLFAGPQYAYAENCSITVVAGNTWFKAGPVKEISSTFFDVGIVHRYSTKNRITQPYGDIAIRHRLATVTLNMEVGVQFIEDPGRVLTRQDQYVASITKETVRTHINLAASLRSYKDLESRELLSKGEEALGTFRYRLTQRTTGTISASFQHLEDRAVQSTTDTTLSTVRLDYRVSNGVFLGWEYRYLASASQQTALNNYRNNREIVELRINF